MSQIKLSIIIPCYNVEKYIDECVDSVVNQGVENYEIILVEDGSNDNTFKKCKRIAETISCVKLIKHDSNCGQEKTRNDGIEASVGEWILFLDGDDIIEKNALPFIYSNLKSDIDVILARFKYYDLCTSFEAQCRLVENKVYASRDLAYEIGENLSWDMISCIGNKVYKKAMSLS